jgi:NAD(P)-dependent dehydrogenase (short-subunit alcohol dehydrogenase family)
MPGPIRYDGRVAIVTGAGAGLGKQYALFLASRGAKVLVNDVAEESAAAVVAEIAASGGEAHAAVGSVADGERIVGAAVERWGRCDILINNAGILRDMAFHKMSPKAFDLVHEVHVRGSFAMTRAAWPHMRAAGYGRVVLITSVNGLYGQFGQANYSSAKAAMVGLAKTLAAEGSGKGILVNALAPGGGTAMTATIMPAELVAKWKPQYVVPCVAYLCSEECEASGRVFEAGGGWMAQVRWQRSPGFFFDLERPFGPEEVRAAWHRVTDFSGAGAPEEDGTLGTNSPQLQQIVHGPSPSKL